MRKFYTLLAVTVICSGVVFAADVKTITGEGKCQVHWARPRPVRT